MRLSDRLAGVLILAFGLTIAAYALATFPSIPGQDVGPWLFPAVIGSGFAVFGAILTLTGLRAEPGPWFAVDEWVRHPQRRRNFAVVVATLVFYILAADLLGFFITAILFLAALFLAFGVAPRRILPLAVVVTLAIHYGFYTLLRVPLPWGVLGGIAW